MSARRLLLGLTVAAGALVVVSQWLVAGAAPSARVRANEDGHHSQLRSAGSLQPAKPAVAVGTAPGKQKGAQHFQRPKVSNHQPPIPPLERTFNASVFEAQSGHASRAKECGEVQAAHRVVPGVSWGSLPVALRAQWQHWDCDALLLRRDRPVSAVATPDATRSSRLTSHAVFHRGLGGYRVFRIPALARSRRTLLAFAEARPTVDDHGEIDLVLRTSTDGGKSWSALQRVAGSLRLRAAAGGGGRLTVGNPAPVVASDGAVVLLFCANDAVVSEDTIRAGKGGVGRRVWVTRSTGADFTRWSDPVEITAAVKRPGWTWYATGPGGGIATSKGALVVPATHATSPDSATGAEDHSHSVVSTDDGKSWQLGADAVARTNEATVAELAGGRLLLNARDLTPRRRRVLQQSADGGASWGEPWSVDSLIEPPPKGCHGSMVAVAGGRTLFFSHPNSEAGRERLTIHRSDDGGRTWDRSLLVYRGPSAYSSLKLLAGPPGGPSHIGILYERGERPLSFFAERIVFERVPLSPESSLGAVDVNATGEAAER